MHSKGLVANQTIIPNVCSGTGTGTPDQSSKPTKSQLPHIGIVALDGAL